MANESEGNNTFATRQVLPVGDLVVNAALAAFDPTATDYSLTTTLPLDGVLSYTLTAADAPAIVAGAPFIVWTDNSPAGADTQLGVFDDADALIKFDDDSSPEGDGFASMVTANTVNPDGTIRLKITGTGDDAFVGGHGIDGDFTLKVRVGVVNIGDVDFFEFPGLDPGTAFSARVTPVVFATPDARLTQYNDAGAVVVSVDDTVGVDPVIAGNVPASGSVILAVTGAADSNNQGAHLDSGAYALTMTATVAPVTTTSGSVAGLTSGGIGPAPSVWPSGAVQGVVSGGIGPIPSVLVFSSLQGVVGGGIGPAPQVWSSGAVQGVVQGGIGPVPRVISRGGGIGPVPGLVYPPVSSMASSGVSGGIGGLPEITYYPDPLSALSRTSGGVGGIPALIDVPPPPSDPLEARSRTGGGIGGTLSVLPSPDSGYCNRRLVWLSFEAQPRLGIYPTSLPSERLEPWAYPALIDVGKIRTSLLSGGEVSNVTVQIDNTDGVMFPLLMARLDTRVRLMGFDEHCRPVERFSGILGVPEGDQDLRVRIIGDHLRDRVPLRKSSSLPNASEFIDLPVVYGDGVRVAPFRYNGEGTQWLLSAGYITRVRSVSVNDKIISPEGYFLRNESDVNGEPVAILEFPAAPDGLLRVVCDGEPDSEAEPDEILNTLAPMTNPGDVLYHLMKVYGGTEIDRRRFDTLRLAMHGVKVRGVCDGTQINLQLLFDEVVHSVGALWSRDFQAIAFPWPQERPHNAPLMGRADALSGIDLTTKPIERITRLTIEYAFDWADRNYQKSITFEAPLLIREGIEREEVVQLRWIGEDRDAEKIGLAIAQFFASERHEVTWTANIHQYDTSLGGYWEFDHLYCPLQGAWPVLHREIEWADSLADLKTLGFVGDVPRIEIVQRTVLEVAADKQFIQERINGRQTIRIKNSKGEYLTGVPVTVDGKRYFTDSSGRIYVDSLTPGQTYEFVATPDAAPVVRGTIRVTA